jgi:hypothetical protein
MELTAQNVNQLFLYLLFNDGEDTTSAVIAHGCVHNIGFHPGRLSEKRADILDMLSQLPIEFQKSGGGGYTFLNACLTANGDQWGDQQVADQLLVMGIASRYAAILLPRELWSSLPGGVPYFVVFDK